MSSPVIPNLPQDSSWYADVNFVALVAGAFLAILGGAVVEYVKIYFDKRQELKCIKISLNDELEEIIDIINKLNEMWEQKKIVHKTYINDLESNMTTYEHHRTRLFLFTDSKIRRSISKFYKDLKKNINDTKKEAGTLDDSAESIAEQTQINTKFADLKTRAIGINKSFGEDDS
ncbi:hypothetical protein KAJ61_00560 [Candidatus Parcubacteria bacterium]|nr:hypothetical protein [Candidatus Parcubacteria bacterium]